MVTDRSWVPVPGKVRVKWGTKDPILYRRGFDGKVDLVAKKSTIGGQYQREWLPVLNTVLQTRKHEGSCFVVGHRVRINAKVGQEDLRDKQAGSARWDPLMVKVNRIFCLKLSKSLYEYRTTLIVSANCIL